MLSTALTGAVLASAIGTAALWVNPNRTMNRALAMLSLYVAAWLLCLHAFFVEPENLVWLGAAWIAAGFFPLTIWLVRDIVLDPAQRLRDRLRHLRYWWLFPLGVIALVSSPFFVALSPTTGRVLYGEAYYAVVFAGFLTHLCLAVTTSRKMLGQSGARRLELQLIILGTILGAVVAYGLLGLAAFLHDRAWERLMPIAVIGLFGGMVWSLLTTRLLDAQHIITIGLEKLVLVAGVSLFVWGTHQIGGQFIPDWLAFSTSIALGLWFAAEVRPWLQELSRRRTAAEKVRKAAFEIARKDLRPEAMETEFLKLLTGWANCERAVILMASQGRLSGGGVEWTLDQPELKLLHNIRWASPERLERQRPRVHGKKLAELLNKEGLGVIVASGGPSLSFAIALSVPRSRHPYTYIEVGQLLALETTIEAALSHAHYLMKAQHAEQLATVGLLGASIAHEIRNPLVSIKTFVQLLPKHYQEAAFREKFFRLISDEVGRMDRLTEQLLDLSAPRVFLSQPTPLHALLNGCIALVGAKADDKGVKIVTNFQAQKDEVHTDPNAIKQVVLNLTFNAIQALEQQPGERWVKFTSREMPAGMELTISDSGPGISQEVWSRLFQPFQSSKSSGFGLGLAICKDILSSLHASITADPPSPGRGATFRIVLPCQPPSA